MPLPYLIKYKNVFDKDDDLHRPCFLVLSPTEIGDLTSTFVLNGERYMGIE
jgi:hypothetical protein